MGKKNYDFFEEPTEEPTVEPTVEPAPNVDLTKPRGPTTKQLKEQLDAIEARLIALEQGSPGAMDLDLLADIRDIVKIARSAWQNKAPNGPTMDKVRNIEKFLKRHGMGKE